MEVLLDELLSQSNTAQMLDHFLFLYIYILCLLLQHYWIISGLLFMPGCAHITKLCKDIGKEVDSVFDPNTQRFGSSLEVGHMWKRFQTASAPPAFSLGHLLRSVASLENTW